MTSTFVSLAIIAALMVQSQRSFVATAPAATTLLGSPEVVPQFQDNDVKELESLKNPLERSIEMMKTHSEVFSNVNGMQEAHSDTKAQLHQNGKLIASLGQRLDEAPGPDGSPTGKLHTKLDIPAEGIHKNTMQQIPAQQLKELPALAAAPLAPIISTDNGNRRASNMEILSDTNNPDKYGPYSGIQYSPLDMAEYVFWTGDEKGVTLAIEEFLQEGLMSREEAISFLQDIKYNLDYLQKHYTEVGLNTRERAKEKESTPNGLFYRNNIKENGANVRVGGNKVAKIINQYNSNQIKTESKKKSNVAWTNFIKEQTKLDQNSALLKQTEQYDELLERLRLADFLYTEYSLEEVIYQLAKVMFTQSLTRGSLEAQQSLQKFTSFLEIEAEQGRISRALEKKVLDVLIASLTDTINEHPELAISNQESVNLETTPKKNLLKEILKLNSGNDKAVSDILSDNARNKVHPLREQFKNNNNKKNLSLDLEKYKQL